MWPLSPESIQTLESKKMKLNSDSSPMRAHSPIVCDAGTKLRGATSTGTACPDSCRGSSLEEVDSVRDTVMEGVGAGLPDGVGLPGVFPPEEVSWP